MLLGPDLSFLRCFSRALFTQPLHPKQQMPLDSPGTATWSLPAQGRLTSIIHQYAWEPQMVLLALLPTLWVLWEAPHPQ